MISEAGAEIGIQRIGFGCSHITGGFEARSNLRILRLAYDLGVRHFDTAPMYGHGTSEEVVGTAFRHDRDRVTIATKIGIEHGSLSRRRQIFRLVTTPLRRWTPQLSKLAAHRIYSEPLRTDFGPSSIDRSLERSLMKLKTDYVDILLLHEATIDDLSDELLKKLQDLIREGKVRRIGVGTGVESLRRIAEARLQFEVYQRPWSVLVPDENLLADHYQIFHGSILSAAGPVGEKLRSNAEALSHVQALCGLECRSSEDVAKVLLLSAVSANPGGLVLFSSRAPARVASYLKFARERAANVTPDLVVTLRSYLSLPC
jgi:aryl-alcohol dehydrogenase-like predicted oxidoreductase